LSVPDSRVYRVPGAEVHPARRQVIRNGTPLYPRAKTFDLLLYLLQHRDRLVGKQELLDALWRDVSVTDNSLVQCVIDLRKALGDDARNPRFIRTVSKGGYQFIAPVEEVWPEPAAGRAQSLELEEVTTIEVEYESAPAPPAAPPAGLLPMPRHRVSIFVLAGLVLLSGVLTALFLARGNDGRKAVAVLYFENQSRSEDLDWLREGLADMLIANLSRSPKLRVISRQQLASALERTERRAGAVRLEDALEIAARTRARAVVLGGFGRLGDKIRIGVQLHDGRDGSLLGAASVTADRPEEILAQVDLLSLKLAAQLGASRRDQELTAGLADTMTRNLEAYRNYSLALEKSQAYHSEEAIELLGKAIALDPEFAMAHARIGYTYAVTWGLAGKGNAHLEKAFRLSQRLTRRDRLYVQAWYALGNLDYPGAIRVYRQLVADYPEEVEAYTRLGHLLRGERQYDAAVAVLKQASIMDPDSPDVYNALGCIYSQLGRHGEAILMAQRYLALAPQEANAHDSLALTYQWAGRFEESKQAYWQALRLKPNFQIAVVNLGNLYYQMGRYRDAIRQYEEYIRIAPSDPERGRGWGCLAWIYRRTGDHRRAEEAARKELEYDPTSAGNALLLALERRDRESAQRFAEQVFAVPAYSHRGARPPQRYHFYFLGHKAMAEGRTEEALAHFREALRHWPPWGAMEAAEDCLADAYLHLGRLDDAISEYERALRLYPGDALARYHLAEALERKGDRERARREYGTFLQLWKEADPDLRELRAAKRWYGGEAHASLWRHR
jgi:tetratricopeptide (TPR) repeat protein/DNA-binding winged helix-turn-helix (wHTH) protein